MAHIRHAQAIIPRSHVLRYFDRPNKNRQWYLGRKGCELSKKPAGTSCDEYPMFKTIQGGPSANRVSLRWVNHIENVSVGAHFGFLSQKLKKSKDKTFVVVPSFNLPTVAIPK